MSHPFTHSSTEFIRNMDQMFETQNMEAGDIAISQAETINTKRLRSALDLCLEELPVLLELGQIPENVQTEYDFPYHRPSVLSIATASSTMMPETLGYVLLQVGFSAGVLLINLCHYPVSNVCFSVEL